MQRHLRIAQEQWQAFINDLEFFPREGTAKLESLNKQTCPKCPNHLIIQDGLVQRTLGTGETIKESVKSYLLRWRHRLPARMHFHH
ncbi:hypothetical protein [Marinospirillum sp.]|uniref:hypothetical protein n=1 Tax=Marinospirillum sp. TaxID=2183934 RepID=UPI00384B2AB5